VQPAVVAAAQLPRRAEVEEQLDEPGESPRPEQLELSEPVAAVLAASRPQAGRSLAVQAPASAQRQMLEGQEARASAPEAQS
jgi:hypothetical protein